MCIERRKINISCDSESVIIKDSQKKRKNNTSGYENYRFQFNTRTNQKKKSFMFSLFLQLLRSTVAVWPFKEHFLKWQLTFLLTHHFQLEENEDRGIFFLFKQSLWLRDPRANFMYENRNDDATHRERERERAFNFVLHADKKNQTCFWIIFSLATFRDCTNTSSFMLEKVPKNAFRH